MRRGFSLVELSIVIVIIGLLVGGILAGQNLIRNAEINSIASDFNRFSTAITAFEERYNHLPGDMPNATAYWRKDNTNCSSHTGTAGTPGVCNGDGDGILEESGASNPTEIFQFWRHLAVSGLIAGDYTGVAGSQSASDYDYGVNSPTASIANAAWGTQHTNNASGSGSYNFSYDYRGYLTMGVLDGILADAPALTGKEAWVLDQKMDDGMPAKGFVHAMPVTSCTDATGTVQNDFGAEYIVNDSIIRCAMAFKY